MQSRPITGNECTCQGGAKECYMADVTNCNGFFVCTSGNKLKKMCPGVLRWSTIKNHCEWPNSVQCGTRPVTASSTGGAKTCNCPAGKSECFNDGKNKNNRTGTWPYSHKKVPNGIQQYILNY